MDIFGLLSDIQNLRSGQSVLLSLLSAKPQSASGLLVPWTEGPAQDSRGAGAAKFVNFCTLLCCCRQSKNNETL